MTTEAGVDRFVEHRRPRATRRRWPLLAAPIAVLSLLAVAPTRPAGGAQAEGAGPLSSWHKGDVHVHSTGDAEVHHHRRCIESSVRDPYTKVVLSSRYASDAACAALLVRTVLSAAEDRGTEWVVLTEHGPWLEGTPLPRTPIQGEAAPGRAPSYERGARQWNLLKGAADRLSGELQVRALMGEELGTTANLGFDAGHFGAYYASKFIDNDYLSSTEIEYVREVGRAGGFGSVNHPHNPDGGSAWDCYFNNEPVGACAQGGAADLAGNPFIPGSPGVFRSIEIINDNHWPISRTLADWDEVLSRGYRIWAVGGSDAHTLDFLGFVKDPSKIGADNVGQTYVQHAGNLVPSGSHDSGRRDDPVRTALFNGRTVASNGPLAVTEVNGSGPGSTINVVKGEPLEVTVRWRTPFVENQAGPKLLRFTLAPVHVRGTGCGATCVKRVDLSPEEAARGEYTTRLTLPPEWRDSYVRVAAETTVTSGKQQQKRGAFVSPVFVHQPDAAETGPADRPVGNPPLPDDQCGVRVALVVDTSFSIHEAGAGVPGQVRHNLQSVARALRQSPSQLSLYNFRLDSVRALPFVDVFGEVGYGRAEDAIDNLQFDTSGSGRRAGTNWEAAFNSVAGLGADLVVFVTDGSPNKYGTTLDQQPPVATEGFDPAALAAGIKASEAVRRSGARVVAVGVGAVRADTLPLISGPRAGSDYFVGDFQRLGQLLLDVAGSFCGGRVVVNTTLDGSPARGLKFRYQRTGDSFQRTATTDANGGFTVTVAGERTTVVQEVTLDADERKDVSLTRITCTKDQGPLNVQRDLKKGEAVFKLNGLDVVTCTYDFRRTR